MNQKPCAHWVGRIIAGCLCLGLILLPVPAFSDPPEGKGRGSEHQNQGNGNENGHANGHSDSSQGRGPGERSQGRSEIARANAARHLEARESRRQRRDSIGPSTSAPGNFEDIGITRQPSGHGNRYAFGKNENPKIISDFEQALKKLENKGHARWSYNPKNDRPQGNRSPLEMLDPYGHSFDDRKEIYGNRGRPIREVSDPEPEPEPTPDPTPEPEPEPDPEPIPEPDPQPPPEPEPIIYVTVSSNTLAAWQYETYGWLYPEVTFASLGYTEQETTFLKSLSYEALAQALAVGSIAMT